MKKLFGTLFVVIMIATSYSCNSSNNTDNTAATTDPTSPSSGDVITADEAFRFSVASHVPRHTACDAVTPVPSGASSNFTHNISYTGKNSSVGIHSYNAYVDTECKERSLSIEFPDIAITTGAVAGELDQAAECTLTLPDESVVTGRKYNFIGTTVDVRIYSESVLESSGGSIFGVSIPEGYILGNPIDVSAVEDFRAMGAHYGCGFVTADNTFYMSGTTDKDDRIGTASDLLIFIAD
ncbi:MAG: hypothetical protein WCQ53_03250 [bacterium]